jgi:hypothetical protein
MDNFSKRLKGFRSRRILTGSTHFLTLGIVMKRSLLFAALVLLGATTSIRAQILTNGGFETPALSPGGFQLITPGTEPTGFAWTVLSGTVDLAHLPVSPFVGYTAFEGNQALDLHGDNPGAITQSFTTVPGQGYRLTLAYADNPIESGISSASIVFRDVATTNVLFTDSISHSTSTNGPPANADWLEYQGLFIATGTSTSLTITSTSVSGSSSGGVFLDNIAIVTAAVPEPSTIMLTCFGGITVGCIVWRQRVRQRRIGQA